MVAPLLTRFSQNGEVMRGSRTQDSGGDSANQTFTPIPDKYALYEAYYTNEPYEALARGIARRTMNSPVYSSDHRAGLYAGIESIYNPIHRAVEWYAGAIYPGVWTPDGLPKNGTPCIVPFESDTDEAIRLPSMTMMRWARWASSSRRVSRTMPMLGEIFGEIYADYERKKAFPRFYHPRHVRNLEFNGTGDVTEYWIEIPQVDEKGQSYRYGKIVTKDETVTLKNDAAFGYDGQDAYQPNPWGFAPGAWMMFREGWDAHGMALAETVIRKIDRVNSSTSSIHDYIAKFGAQGVVFKTDTKLPNGGMIGLGNRLQELHEKTKDEIRYIKGPADLTIDRLIENLGLADAQWAIQDLIREAEADIPEATIDRDMRAAPQMSGVSRRMTYGDVGKRFDEASGNADEGVIKLIQMGLTINGEEIRRGAFGPRSGLSEQQKLFQAFTIQSYDRGDLDFSFVARDLFPDTELDKVQVSAMREKITTPTGLAELGYSPDDIYGEGQAPKAWPGLLDQRDNARGAASAASLLSFNQGVLP